jgi:isoaspartyl peptidase/L-asparaginase-like protein (Ntn-hydrolase superfamily)
MRSPTAIAVHGGAGRVPSADADPAWCAAAERGLRAALAAGAALLDAGGSALGAVVAAVAELERCEVFNAGRGCVLDAEGGVSLDAAVMDGSDRRAGGVIGVARVAQPVEAAEAVLRDGRHVLMAGEGAERFAASCGLAMVDPSHHVTEKRRAQLERARRKRPPGGGTVGAVALDADGHLAAATSTGGMAAKRPGRVADSALIGCGTWADDSTCAVSATGHGEFFIRTVFAREIDARMRWAGRDLDTACAEALAAVSALGGSGGCIALDARGRAAFPFDTPHMPCGLRVAGGPVQVSLHGHRAESDSSPRTERFGGS